MKLSYDEIEAFISEKIQPFHDKRLENLNSIQLSVLLKRKNPYLFKAKSINTAFELVKAILDAQISSSEETIFGGFLEELAIYICSNETNGYKSSAEGIDLEFERDVVRYIVSIKSGPNWGNSSQVKKMKEQFAKAKKILRTNNPTINIVCINGCCYGKDEKSDKGDYFKYCGQRFWHFISGDESLYQEIIKPIAKKSKIKTDLFQETYDKRMNLLTSEFSKEFCDTTGGIMWDKLLEYNSGWKK